MTFGSKAAELQFKAPVGAVQMVRVV